jgi:hypothetical protein
MEHTPARSVRLKEGCTTAWATRACCYRWGEGAPAVGAGCTAAAMYTAARGGATKLWPASAPRSKVGWGWPQESRRGGWENHLERRIWPAKLQDGRRGWGGSSQGDLRVSR